jgi:peptide/nickel transport system permease protein
MTTSAPALSTRRRGGGWTNVLRSPTLRFLGRRTLTAIPVLWGVTFLTFLVINLMPGNAARALLGISATPEDIRALEHKLHLDEPFFTRYWHWLTGAMHGNFGHSLASGQSVGAIFSERLPITFELLGYAFFLSLLLAVPIAVLAARKPNGIADRITMMVSMVGLSVPAYVLALVLVYVFAVSLGWLPAIGFVHLSESVPRNIEFLTLPAVSIAFPLFCFYTRLLRADILDQLSSQDYVVTALAKGLGPWRVLTSHVLRNSLFGLVTLVGLNFGTLVGVTVIIEPIFSLPGIGQQLLESIGTRDVPIIESIVLVFGLMVVVANLLTDLLYAVLDPRIRYGRAAG